MKRLEFLLAAAAVLLAPSSWAAADSCMLSGSVTVSELKTILDSQTGWPVFPGYGDRKAWESLPESARREYIAAGERALDFQWGVIPAMSYIEFTRSGDRGIMERPSNARNSALRSLVLAELSEGKGRFIEQIINGVWAICEQSTWVGSAHLPAQRGGAGLPNPDDTIIDLHAASLGSLMSWTYYFFADEFDKVSPWIGRRMRDEIRRRVLEPYYSRENFFWQGFNGSKVNNWNTYCNYYVLNAILLMEDDPQRRAEGVWKVMRSLDYFIDGYPDDGGCDEGPSYWTMSGGKLFENLEVLDAVTGGKLNIFHSPKIRNIGRYAYRAYIGDEYVTDFADSPVKMAFAPGVLYRFGRAIEDDTMMSFGAWIARTYNKDRRFGGSLEYILMNLFRSVDMFDAEAAEPLVRDSWLPDTQLVTARDRAGSKEGFYFAAKGGHNAESHNHNDVGSFMLYYNADPVLIDVGVGTYMRQTFGPERYTIWNMRSLYHNLPVINGTEQQYGRRFAARSAAYSANDAAVSFSLDVAGAYAGDAGVGSWVRGYRLLRGKSFRITDRWNLKENRGGNALVFMTAKDIELDARRGAIYFNGEGYRLRMKFNPAQFDAVVEKIEVEDKMIAGAWGDTVSRIVLSVKSRSRNGASTIEITPVK